MDKITRDTPAPDGLHAHIFCDGSCPENPGPMGTGYVINIDQGDNIPTFIECGARFNSGTNNRAEYLSLIFALRTALRSGITHVQIYMDSLLVVNQVGGRWKVRDGLLKLLHTEATGLMAMFSFATLEHIPRENNQRADELSRTPTEPDTLPSDLEINLKGKRQRVLSRWQAAMVRWWWVTHRCQNEYRLSRIFNVTPSHLGRIGEGKAYPDITARDLPGETDEAVIDLDQPVEKPIEQAA